LYSALASKGKQVDPGEAACVLKKERLLRRQNRATGWAGAKKGVRLKEYKRVFLKG